MKKFIVEANVRGGMMQEQTFSSRNPALKYLLRQAEWHGGDWYLNGKLKRSLPEQFD